MTFLLLCPFLLLKQGHHLHRADELILTIDPEIGPAPAFLVCDALTKPLTEYMMRKQLIECWDMLSVAF